MAAQIESVDRVFIGRCCFSEAETELRDFTCSRKVSSPVRWSRTAPQRFSKYGGDILVGDCIESRALIRSFAVTSVC